MTFCIPKTEVERMKEGIKNGILAPERLITMSSVERRALFEDILGQQLGREANVLFESKLVLESQKRGIENWVKQVSGEPLKKDFDVVEARKEVIKLRDKLAKTTDVFVQRDLTRKIEKLNDRIEKTDMKEPVLDSHRRDMLAKLERLDRVLDAKSQREFLQDLAETRLGLRVNYEQASQIVAYTREIKQLQAEIKPGTPLTDPKVQRYGLLVAKLDQVVGKLRHENLSVNEMLMSPDKWLDLTFGTFKSLKASFDNSFWLRQGWHTLATHPTIWARNFKKSWKDMALEVMGEDATLLGKAEVFARENARNGVYERAGLDIGVAFEETYPSSLPRKIPGFNRAYGASESAFQVGAMRVRAELFDHLYKEMTERGIDLTNAKELQRLGEFVNSVTGRGKLKKFAGASHELNLLLFSPRWIKSRVDTLMAPSRAYINMPLGKARGKEYTPAEVFIRRKAAKETLQVLGTMAAVLTAAEIINQMANPGSDSIIELDPRSSAFGKIKIGNTRFDVSAGLGAFITLASRMVPTSHKGDWGWWGVDSKGRYKKVVDLDYKGGLDVFSSKNLSYVGSTGIDYLVQFLLNKASPGAMLGISLLEGKSFGQDEVTAPLLAGQLVIPIPFETWYDLASDPKAAPVLWAMIAETLGIGTSTY